MWLIDWLVSRYSTLVQLLDVLFQPIVNIVNNVVTWINSAASNAVVQANNFSNTLASIKENIMRAYVQTLHIFGINFTTGEVTKESIVRNAKDASLEQIAVLNKQQAKLDLIQEEITRKKEDLLISVMSEQKIMQLKGETKASSDAQLSLIDQLRSRLNLLIATTGDLLESLLNDPAGFFIEILLEIGLDLAAHILTIGFAPPDMIVGELREDKKAPKGGIKPKKIKDI